MTVDELTKKISSAELTEWIAFSRLEPFGSEFELLGYAIVCATMVNTLKQLHKARGRDVKVSDFIPDFDKILPKSPKQVAKFGEMLMQYTGGEDRRPK